MYKKKNHKKTTVRRTNELYEKIEEDLSETEIGISKQSIRDWIICISNWICYLFLSLVFELITGSGEGFLSIVLEILKLLMNL